MDYTLSVFKNEGNIKGTPLSLEVKREELAKKVGLGGADDSQPVLMQLLNQEAQSFSEKKVEKPAKKDNSKKEQSLLKEKQEQERR